MARMREGMSAFKNFKHTDKHTGRRPLGKPRHKWEINIRIDLTQLGST